MSREKVDGVLIGVGAGVLLAAFLEFREEPGASVRDGDDASRRQVATELGSIVAPSGVKTQAAHP
jgi:hypothetical protein